MAAPDIWSAPSSGGTDPSGLDNSFQTGPIVTVAGSYLFATGRSTGSGDYVPRIRYATDPTGAWTIVTSLPSNPTGYTCEFVGGVSFDGSVYACIVKYVSGTSPGANTSTTTWKTRIFYTSDPTGTWTAFEYDATDVYHAFCLQYLNGEWVMGGFQYVAYPSTRPAMLGYCSTATGSWTFKTGATDTGVTTGASWNTYNAIKEIDYSGSHYALIYATSGNYGTGIRVSTTLVGGWAAPSSFPFTSPWNLVWHGDASLWTVASVDSSNPRLTYASDPTGTWTQVTNNVTKVNTFKRAAFGSGFWVMLDEKTTAPGIAYYESTGAPTGTWTRVSGSAGFTSPSRITHVVYSSSHGRFVAIGDESEIRYSTVVASMAPAYLRQRQSPRATPQRVRGTDLRQRQTPFVT